MKSITLITLLYITLGIHPAVGQPGKSDHRVNLVELMLAGRNDQTINFTPAAISRVKNRTIEIQRINFSESTSLDTFTYLLQNHERLQSLREQKDKRVLRTTIKISPHLQVNAFAGLMQRLNSLLRQYLFDQRSNELFLIVLPPRDNRYSLLFSQPKVFEMNSLKGLIDFNGDTLIPAIYEHLVFKDGDIVLARKEKKMGAVSTTNKVLIPFRYDNMIYFYTPDRAEAMISVTENGKNGILNVSGEAIVDVVYDDLTGVNGNGLYIYSKNGKWGWLSFEKELVHAKYKSVVDFYQRGTLPAFLVQTESGYEIRDLNDKRKGDPIGHLNRFVLQDTLLIAESNTGTGIISNQGKVILPLVHDEISETHESRFWYVSKNGKYGIFDAQTAKFIVPLSYNGRGEGYRFDSLDLFSFRISEAKTGKVYYGIVNANNKIITPFKYDAVSFCNEGFIVIQKDKKYGALDRNGRTIAKLKYEYLECAAGVAAQVYKLNGKYGYMYEDGRLMTEPLFDQPIPFPPSYTQITVSKDGEQFCLTIDGDLHTGECSYD